MNPKKISFNDYEVLVEILLRFPLGLVNRCKLVSRDWLSLISSSYFFQRYESFLLSESDASGNYRHSLIFQRFELNSYDKHGVVELESRKPPFNSINFPFNSLPQDIKLISLVGSCNGLVLFWVMRMDHTTLFYICNPLTIDWVLLPPLQLPQEVVGPYVGFISDRSYDFAGEGDGFSSSNASARYRVVVVPYFCHKSYPGFLNLRIFCTETWEWIEVPVPHPSGLCYRYFQPPFNVITCNGMLHWYGEGVAVYDPFHKPDHCGFVYPPRDLTFNPTMGVHRGRIQLCPSKWSDYFRVWELKDYNTSEWWLRYTVRLGDIASDISSASSHLPLNFRAFSAIDGDVICFSNSKSVLLCNMKTKTVEVLFASSVKSFSHRVFPFVFRKWPTAVPRPELESEPLQE